MINYTQSYGARVLCVYIVVCKYSRWPTGYMTCSVVDGDDGGKKLTTL